MKKSTVTVKEETLIIPTYLPKDPDKNPMFLEKRVYQGSSGKVYPLPFTDRIAEEKVDRPWKGVWIENEYLRVLVLPEIGGRIHIGQDKTNGYDFFYRQNVIKPALVGLAGSWISGGVEFNWPQHHRPATFMPVEYKIEEEADGSKTIWCSDHDPLQRMKGMHGVCLRPGKAVLELKVRAYNRTQTVQTFLWWANVATRVHELYQSFFPPDVSYVADHAKRAMSEFPLCKDHYYGVNYGARAKNGVPENEVPSHFVPEGGYAPNDLSWYANIPVPTSYMAMGSNKDFFGGYDHGKEAGLVHIANHHISPGKKQWTWGNHDFGYAWDRHLTDEDGPYIELMAGVYTDNQPDFSFLNPGETKTWTQFWYPIQKIGPAHHANQKAAANILVKGNQCRIGVAVTESVEEATITLSAKGKKIQSWKKALLPNQPLVEVVRLASKIGVSDLILTVQGNDGETVIRYQPEITKQKPVPPAATEPALPKDIPSVDELYVTGLHLDQYRHATRQPQLYWLEGLKRDAGDSRCNLALGIWHYKRGEFSKAESHLRKSIERLTKRNPNPYDGEAYYQLGLTLRMLGHTDEAYNAFYKSAWNMAWQAPAYLAIAEINCVKKEWDLALDHLKRSLRMNCDQLWARNLKSIVLLQLGQIKASSDLLHETLALDPLDACARYLQNRTLPADSQIVMDLAHDFVRAGLLDKALEALNATTPDRLSGTAPTLEYFKGWIHSLAGNTKKAVDFYRKAEKIATDYCFPSRLEEILILQSAIQHNSKAAHARYYLGNLYYDRRRHHEAIQEWESSVKINPKNAIAWRNLGIGYYNVIGSPSKARDAYEKAIKINSKDARLFYERDQLWKRLKVIPSTRLAEFEKNQPLVKQRDDLCVEYCDLLNQTGKSEIALDVLSKRKFQPWEGGEGMALGQHVKTHLLLGQKELKNNKPEKARELFEAALNPPQSLGETRHLLANQSDVWYWLGIACSECEDLANAKSYWNLAASFKGDFQNMSIKPYSELTYFSAMSLHRLGKKQEAKKLLENLLKYATALEKEKASIDYFATSLPTMLLFDEDIQKRQVDTARYIQAQAKLGLKEIQKK